MSSLLFVFSVNTTIHRMIPSRLLKRCIPFSNRFYFCWAIPLLRLCITTNNYNPGHYTYRSNVGIFCGALSPVSTSTNPRNPWKAHIAPHRLGSSRLLLVTPNVPIWMTRRNSPVRGARHASTKNDIPEADDSSVSSSRKRDRATKSPTKDWSSLKVVELKEELAKRGLKTTGKKADLVSLLEQHDGGSDTDDAIATKSPKKRTKAPTTPKRKTKTNPTAVKPSPKKKSSPTKKAADHQRITDIDKLPKLWNGDMAKANGSYTFKIASWNVAGLRALVRKGPDDLANLCRKHNLDMLCLQETKLQGIHLEDPKLKLRGILDEAGYDEHWSCSTAKKGYSGTAIFVKRQGKGIATKKGKQATIGSYFAPKKKNEEKTKQKSNSNSKDKSIPKNPEMLTPTNVGFSVGKEIDNEGRVIFLEFPWATIANVYVPNSGQKLERLDYRTKEWDKFFLKFMQEKQKERGLPVIWLGDLNIAHKAYDIWNDGAKHLAKQAGVTEQERESFTEQLNAGFVDVFRKLHPNAKGNYSYWSQRAGNREPNKGLRLDYFVASEEMFSEDSKVIPRDSYMIMDQLGSDHSPVVLELEIKG